MTPSDTVMRRLSIAWGVFPVKKAESLELEAVFEIAREVVLETDVARKGDLVVITAGLPLNITGSTNLVKVQSV